MVDTNPIFLSNNQYLSHYFDTKVGAKQEVASYQTISTAVQIPAGDILFLTDIPGEARAAIASGMRSLILIRPGNGPLTEAELGEFSHVANFNQIVFE